MKIIYFLLASYVLTQQETILTVDDQVDKFAEDFTNSVNKKNQDDYQAKKKEFDDQMDEIQEEVQGVVNGYRVINMGTFSIQSTDNCEALPIVPTEPVTPEELECVTAKYDASLMTKTILSLTKTTPLDYESIYKSMVECEIMGSGKIGVKLNIYQKCLEASFEKLYQEHFEALKQRMASEGYVYNQTTKEFEKKFELEGFEASAETKVVPNP